MLDITRIQKEVRALAVEHGWWPAGGRDTAEVIANFHAEVSEAWEEWRKGKGLAEVYYHPDRPVTPEGVPIEIADLVIRVADAAAAWGCDVTAAFPRWEHLWSVPIKGAPPTVVCLLHAYVNDVQEAALDDDGTLSHPGAEMGCLLGDIIVLCQRVALTWGFDLEKMVWLKHEYNKTREFRHGGKRA